jgi:hypothetical protein
MLRADGLFDLIYMLVFGGNEKKESDPLNHTKLHEPGPWFEMFRGQSVDRFSIPLDSQEILVSEPHVFFRHTLGALVAGVC